MTTLDRAFIKAYGEAGPGSTSAARRATAATAAPCVGIAAIGQPVGRAPRVPEAADIGLSESLAPLSKFACGPKIHETFRAELEVDRLTWPPACQSVLSRAGKAWNRFADQLIERGALGQKCLAIASINRGEGRTTVCLAAAKHLAARGLRPVVVDADFENPNLARSCDLAAYTGWGDVLQAELPLGEALVAAIDDGVTLMPWRASGVAIGELTSSLRTATSFGILRDHYDFVLVDAMPLVDPSAISEFARFAEAARVDAVYVVQDVRWTISEHLAGTCARLRRAGLQVEGIIENFLPPAGRGEGIRQESLLSVASRALAPAR